MDSTVRHFVSQKFGRASGTVRLDHAGQGMVQVDFLDSAAVSRQFKFLLDAFSDKCFQQHDFADGILRIAIGRLHREAKHPQGICSISDLVCGEAMWLGDFTRVRFEGATLGFGQSAEGTVDRRRKEDSHDATVAAGAHLVDTGERQAARAFMQDAGVPPSVIRRVLSGTRTQRKK